jgi:hypothetical protein
MVRNSGNSSIDAKTVPLTAGLLLVFGGLIIAVLGIYSIVMAAIGKASMFGLIGGILLTPVGIMMLVIGSIVLFFSTLRRMSGGKGRILY